LPIFPSGATPESAFATVRGVGRSSVANELRLQSRACSIAIFYLVLLLYHSNWYHRGKPSGSLSNPAGEFRNSHARTPHHLLVGTVTPNGLHFPINHSGVPDIDPAQHKLVIHGMVRQVTRMAFVECAGNSAPMFSNEPMQVTAQAIHGLVSNAEWSGVRLSTILDEAGIDPHAT
jgi:Oxidoreductase molybdopterin binding domain